MIVYTAIFGGRDSYSEPPPGPFKSVVFTDNKIEVDRALVEIISVTPWSIDRIRKARRIKVLSHRYADDDVSVWVDGSYTTNRVDFVSLAREALADFDVAAFRHPKRDCVYKEADECLACSLDHPEYILPQMERYKAKSYPERAGLWETGILLRRKSRAVDDFNELWWDEIERGSRRDQLSFGYSALKSKVSVFTIPGTPESNGFTIRPHVR